jgi:Gpi18-like mannosyltransferase
MVRLWLAATANDIIDVENYRRVAEALLARGPFALYTGTPGIYPYPPPWAAIEAAALWLERAFGWNFSIVVRLPAILADIGIVYVIWRWTLQQNDQRLAFWRGLGYALNPVTLIITCWHGQFDAIPALFSLLALYWASASPKPVLSALCLAVAIAFKSYPVLLLAPILLTLPGWRERLKYAGLALVPVLVLLLPFVVNSPLAVFQELIGYRGSALLGVLVPLRMIYVPVVGESFPVDLTVSLIRVSAFIFLIAYAGWLVYSVRARPRLLNAGVSVLVAFYVLYAGIAPQYLLWVLPLLFVGPPARWRPALIYSAAGTVALVGFYLYAIPELFPYPVSLPRFATQLLYGVGGTLWYLACGLILWLKVSEHSEVLAEQ